MIPPEYMTPREAAIMFSRPEQTIYTWVRSGALRTLRFRGKLFVNGHDVAERHRGARKQRSA